MLDAVLVSKQTVCLQVIPQLIKALYHCSTRSLTGESAVYSEIDYVFDKIDAAFSTLFQSIDFYMKDWTLQEYYCTLYAELQYFYHKRERWRRV